MSGQFDPEPVSQPLREKIIGLGERSIRKSYYPQLQQRLEEVEQAHKKLAESEARFRHLVENVSDVIFSLDTGKRVTYISPAITNLTSWRTDQITGKTFTQFIHPDDRARFLVCIDQADTRAHSTELRFQSANEEYRYMRLSCRNQIQQNERDGLTGVMSDITDRKLAEEEQDRLRQQLTQAQKMESIGRLAGGVAHDFNNMLSVILGHTEMILWSLPPDNPIYQRMQEIHHAADRSADLTHQLLAFARKQRVEPRILDLNETVESMLKMLRRLLGEDIDLAWLPGKDDMTVNMDPSQIDQILANLCVNARDAITGSGNITIGTHLVVRDEVYREAHPGEGAPGEFVMLTITDNGCGMNKETVDRIFEPFYTTKEVGKGTGLGLSTVYGIVKQNSGFITVYSEPGLGTTFKVHLPHVVLPKQETANPQAVEIVHGTETVLLVEDEPTLLVMVRHVLENLGYKVLATGKPEVAIQMAREYSEDIHLLLTDIVMPKMYGPEMADTIIQIKPQIKLLFMSGYAAAGAASHEILKSGTHFLQKPFSIQSLSVKVREALDSP